MTRSQLFTTYNKALRAARAGKLDQGRVNRALGILQSSSGATRLSNYSASIRTCGCIDAGRGNVCKHRIARMIEKRIQGASA